LDKSKHCFDGQRLVWEAENDDYLYLNYLAMVPFITCHMELARVWVNCQTIVTVLSLVLDKAVLH